MLVSRLGLRPGRIRTAQSASAALGCPTSSLIFAPKVRKNRYKHKDDTILFPCISFDPGFEYKQARSISGFKCRLTALQNIFRDLSTARQQPHKQDKAPMQSTSEQELAELSAETRDIALSRFRVLEPHLEQHRSSRQTREFPFRRHNFFDCYAK
jgi:hypothetical protein